MQITNLNSSSQNQPSLALLEEGLQVRLERATFAARFPLELYQQNDYNFTTQNIDATINHLELTLMELNHLANELRWLKWIKSQTITS